MTTTTTTPRRKTRTVAGQRITLTLGYRYWASRPWAERGRRIYPVTISLLDRTEDARVVRVVFIDGLTYEQANDLINAFNNGPISFDGRTW